MKPIMASIREGSLLRKMNWTMASMVTALLIVGAMFMFSAGEASSEPLFKKQAVWALLGVGCYLVLAITDYRNWLTWAWVFYAVSIILLVVVLIFGTKIGGGRRWLMLFGSIGIQPSEFAKLATILLLSARLNRSSLRGADLWFWIETFALVGIPVVLTAAEPDFGTALVFVPILFAMMFVAGCRKRLLLFIVGSMVGVTLLMVACLLLPAKLHASRETQSRIIHMLGMKDYHQTRLRVFLDPELDPLNSGWNMRQSIIAVGSGGLTGKGYTKGTQNVLGFLPVSTTDFIFSVLAEESGFVGSLTVLTLFGFLLWGGTQAGLKSRDKVGRILCSGIVTLIFVHVFVNISMTVGLLPIIGMPLPLLSYGGSFMITVMSSLGLLQSVWIRSKSSVEEFDE